MVAGQHAGHCQSAFLVVPNLNSLGLGRGHGTAEVRLLQSLERICVQKVEMWGADVHRHSVIKKKFSCSTGIEFWSPSEVPEITELVISSELREIMIFLGQPQNANIVHNLQRSCGSGPYQ